MIEERKYKYNGTIPQWLPGVGVIKPGQTFVSRFPIVGNPCFTLSTDKPTPTGELAEDDKVCKKCVRVKKTDKSIKNKKKE